jgi:uncharacterized protein
MRVIDLFSIPILDKFLFYAPLHHYAAILEKEELNLLYLSLAKEANDGDPNIPSWVKSPDCKTPVVPIGPITNPLFLGLITTRDCNMRCRYCDFSNAPEIGKVLSFELAKVAIDAYLDLLGQSGMKIGEVQFFGGEPFYRNRAVEFSVSYARQAAARKGIELRFEATTNGMFDEKRCEWIAENLDTVVLSFDGKADIQDTQRPLLNGRNSYGRVFRNAKILSEGSTDLIVRVCITDRSVHQLLETAQWLASEFNTSAICFEPMTAGELAEANELRSPDPFCFARNFLTAEEFLEQYGIPAITSGTGIEQIQYSVCPLGKDALLVSPEGRLNGCYLLEKDWERAGLDLNFGQVDLIRGCFQIDQSQVESIRTLAAKRSPLCEACYCKYHCAGGCHVNHRTAREGREYDSLCIQTRLITAGKLLKRIRQDELYHEWLTRLEGDPNAKSQTSRPLL